MQDGSAYNHLGYTQDSKLTNPKPNPITVIYNPPNPNCNWAGLWHRHCRQMPTMPMPILNSQSLTNVLCSKLSIIAL